MIVVSVLFLDCCYNNCNGIKEYVIIYSVGGLEFGRSLIGRKVSF